MCDISSAFPVFLAKDDVTEFLDAGYWSTTLPRYSITCSLTHVVLVTPKLCASVALL